MLTVLYIIWQCTWGFLQTLLGFIVFLVHLRRRHCFYHGAIVTGWHKRTGVSLGLFVFVPDEPGEGKKLPLTERSGKMLIHEYGHTIQSLMLGPLYLFIIGIPSALWCSLPYCKKMRKVRRISYYSFYPEKWADRLREKATRK